MNKILSVIIIAVLFCGIDGFAQNQPEGYPFFDEKNAFRLLEKQCSFGTRNPGGEGHRLCGEFLVSYLKKYSNSVEKQNFTPELPNNTIPMYNIITSFDLLKQNRILLCAHWDTRPRADKESDSTKALKPILGANDGASGVAVLLEIARLVSTYPPPIGITIVLFDGEDWGKAGDLEHFSLGSKYYASQKSYPYPDYGILLDMIGDKDLQIYMEEYSYYTNPALVESIWISRAIAELGLVSFVPRLKYQVYDDHIPLIKAGIPMVDIIDFDYPYWHTLSDTPDKCSPKSLKQIGELLVSLIYNPIKSF